MCSHHEPGPLLRLQSTGEVWLRGFQKPFSHMNSRQRQQSRVGASSKTAFSHTYQIILTARNTRCAFASSATCAEEAADPLARGEFSARVPALLSRVQSDITRALKRACKERCDGVKHLHSHIHLCQLKSIHVEGCSACVNRA